MISNSDRARVQVFIEESIGCYDVTNLKQYKSQFEAFTVTDENKQQLIDSSKKDGRDLYFKGALSLAQGISDVNYGLHSWAVAKFYYAIFYFLKASLALRGFGIIRAGGPIYSLKFEVNQVPNVVKTTKQQKGDHKTALAAWRELVGESNDILLSNNIDEVEPYLWLMHARETVQYRRKTFVEPSSESFFSNLVSKNLSKALQIYADDPDPIYPFEKDNACLALPVYRGLLTFEDLKLSGLKLTSPERLVLHSLVGNYIENNSKLSNIF